MKVKHNFQSEKADGNAPDMLQPSHWNAEHVLELGEDDNFVTAEEQQKIASIPAMPTEDGMWILRITGGVATWENLTIS